MPIKSAFHDHPGGMRSVRRGTNAHCQTAVSANNNSPAAMNNFFLIKDTLTYFKPKV